MKREDNDYMDDSIFVNGDSFKTDEERKKFIDKIVSGDLYEDDGLAYESGSIIIPFDKLVEMVDEGCNIISANYHNKYMVEVVYQKMYDVEEMGRKR